MTDQVPESRRPWFAVLALAGLLITLAVLRPGPFARDSTVTYRMLTTFGMVAAVATLAWRFHGLLAAAAAISLLLLADSPPHGPAAFLERGADAAFVGLLALAVASGAGANHHRLRTWGVFALAVAALIGIGVCEWELPTADDPIARGRTCHLVVALTLLTGLVVCLGRTSTTWTRLNLLVLWVGVPAVVVGSLRLATGTWPMAWGGDVWSGLRNEWSSAAWADAAWCWAPPWVAVGLLGLGLWRTMARGFQQRRSGDAPVAWLVGFAGLAAVVALTPRPVAPDSLALAAAGALVSVFGLADSALAVVERIALKPPPPGPSDVPRVR